MKNSVGTNVSEYLCGGKTSGQRDRKKRVGKRGSENKVSENNVEKRPSEERVGRGVGKTVSDKKGRKNSVGEKKFRKKVTNVWHRPCEPARVN